jgi:DnaJ-domain-containing protein 1
MREQAARHAADSRPDHENPWWSGTDRPTLSQLGAGYDIDDDDRTVRYADWAARLRARGATGTATDDAAPTSQAYWRPEALFADSHRREREGGVARRNPWVVRELLAVLDLGEGATSADIGSAYRRLAKEHHPDRYMMADARTQAFHEAEMRRVIDAYEALRQVGA